MIAAEDELFESQSVAAAVAVISAIASADAACCAALRRRSRAEDRRDTVALVRQISPNGNRAAAALLELLNFNITAQEALIPVNKRHVNRVFHRAKKVLEFAKGCVDPEAEQSASSRDTRTPYGRSIAR